MKEHNLSNERCELRDTIISWQFEADRICLLADVVDEPDALLTAGREIFGDAEGHRLVAAIINVVNLTAVDDQIDVSVPVF
jgi:hypothetical protein